jgi:hypothetical protein
VRAVLGAIACAFVLAGCQDDMQAAAQHEYRQTGQNQVRLIARQPAPVLDHSLERANLIERLRRINQQNMTGCIYLISNGAVMAFYPVRGKVTSLNAYLSATGDAGVEMPDFDGAYGKNADGVFFFTADTNAYVEWQGEYLWSDQCLSLHQQPLLVRRVADR